MYDSILCSHVATHGCISGWEAAVAHLLPWIYENHLYGWIWTGMASVASSVQHGERQEQRSGTGGGDAPHGRRHRCLASLAPAWWQSGAALLVSCRWWRAVTAYGARHWRLSASLARDLACRACPTPAPYHHHHRPNAYAMPSYLYPVQRHKLCHSAGASTACARTFLCRLCGSPPLQRQTPPVNIPAPKPGNSAASTFHGTFYSVAHAREQTVTWFSGFCPAWISNTLGCLLPLPCLSGSVQFPGRFTSKTW